MAFRACRTTKPESDGFSDGCEAALRGMHSQAALGNDRKGVPRSDGEAAKWFRRAAEQGMPEAVDIIKGLQKEMSDGGQQ